MTPSRILFSPDNIQVTNSIAISTLLSAANFMYFVCRAYF